MPSVFISYRRSDSIAFTGRIYDRLTAAFGKNNVFKDVDNIRPGEDFRQVLDRALNRSDVLLVIIGTSWLMIADDYGNRRLNDPKDYVRIEIETGLKRDDVLVIPVLVNDAEMPPTDSLPSTLRDLAYRNNVSVRNDPDFNNDINSLIRVIQDQAGSGRSPLLTIIGALLLLAVIAAAVIFGVLPRLNQPPSPTPSQVAQVVETKIVTDEPTAAPTTTPTPTDAPIAAVTSEPTANLTPTVLYPDGRAVQLLYDETSLYAYNLPGQSRLEIDRLGFEALSADNLPVRAYNGTSWSGAYAFLDSGNCIALEILQATRHLRPGLCQGSGYNALRTPNSSANTVFWTEASGASEFRVLWDGLEVGRCPTGSGTCEIRVPRS